MRIKAGLPPNRWDEFICTANYLLMRVPTKSLHNQTPFEAYYHHKPDVSHLREIGCRAFVLILNKHNPKIFRRSEECVLIGYGQNSKSYRCYHRASHKVIESYHVVFVESKDEKEVSFRPGTTQGLDDESIVPPPETPNPTPGVLLPPNLITPTPTPIPDPVSAPAKTPEPTQQPPVVQPIRRSGRVSTISSRSAEASGLHKLSAVQRATADSIASKARLDAEKHGGRHSRQSSATGEAASQRRTGRHSRQSSAAGETASPDSQPDSLSSSLPDLAELAFKAIDDLSDSQMNAVLEQLYGDGYEWGLPSDAGASHSEEPCTFAEAMASPDAPKWLAA
jgi:hypothetical protein